MDLWERYREARCDVDETGLSVDFSRVRCPREYFGDRLSGPETRTAVNAIRELEHGAIAKAVQRRVRRGISELFVVIEQRRKALVDAPSPLRSGGAP
jgi:hypothetical protein